jgi:hypothetical protein
MQSFTTLAASFSFLSCFEVMLDRKIVLASIEVLSLLALLVHKYKY